MFSSIGVKVGLFFKILCALGSICRVPQFVAYALVIGLAASEVLAQDSSNQVEITNLKDPPICSSFESVPNENSFGCEVTPHPNGNDGNGDPRKVVKIKLKAQTKEISIGGELIETENYGTYLPPVVEARAGDTVGVTLTNDLGKSKHVTGSHGHHCEPDSEHLTAPEHPNPTNLHYFHGGIVTPANGNSDGKLKPKPDDKAPIPANSPRWGTGDNIYSCLERGQEHTFTVPIPGFEQLNAAVMEGGEGKMPHPPGLNWYHSHLHGISSNQVMGGMAGLLSVGPRDANLRADCKDLSLEECEEKTEELRRNTLVKYALLRDISLNKNGEGNWTPDPKGQNFGEGRVCGVAGEDGVTFAANNEGLRKGFCQPNLTNDQTLADPDKLWLFTINGQKFPTIVVDETKTGVLIRLGNLSPNFAYWLELYDENSPAKTKKMTIVSVDGVVPAKPQPASDPGGQISIPSYRVSDLLLMPASRVEIYIDRREVDDPTEDKTFVLRTKELDTGRGGDVWPEIQLARITFNAVKKKEPPVLLALNAARTESIAAAFAGGAARVKRPLPQGCMRDLSLSDREYRRVEFANDFNPAGGKWWRIATSIVKGNDVQKDDDGIEEKIDAPFQKYVKSDHSINWSGEQPDGTMLKHTCIELRKGSEAKPQLWELKNNTGELHNFHIHQMKFRLAKLQELIDYKIVDETPPYPPSSTCAGEDDCKQPDYNLYDPSGPQDGLVSNLGRAEVNGEGTITSIIEWHDTIPMPPGSRVYVMMSFADDVQAGRFVYHCHILKHEDNGLMAPIEVWDPYAQL